MWVKPVRSECVHGHLLPLQDEPRVLGLPAEVEMLGPGTGTSKGGYMRN